MSTATCFLRHAPQRVLCTGLLALCAALAAPALAFALGLDTYWILACSAMSALLIWRHKDNIKRLLAGQESRIGSKKKGSGT